MKRILVTGGCGFIGSHYIRYALANHKDWDIINLDKLTYAGNVENISEFAGNSRHAFIKGDICDRELVRGLFDTGIDGVIHFAAESHVDRSIIDSGEFVNTNVKGTLVLLEQARQYGVEKFVHISTDEVYGELGRTGVFYEHTAISPNNPYSASKAGAELFVQAYIHTYRFPAIITRSSNNYGSHQHPEKLIPILITHALNDKPLPIHGRGLNVRDWLHVEDNCRAIDLVYERGAIGEVYNIGGDCEKQNLEMAKLVLELTGKSPDMIEFVENRKGNDARYALDISKISRELGWSPRIPLRDGLRETIRWYQNNTYWLKTWDNLKGYDTFI